MRVTVLCSDLSQNGLSRANLLSEILSRDFDVDVIGSCFGNGIWEPARAREFHRVVPGARWPWYARSAAALLRSIRGDVIYAIKPLPSSFGLALLSRARTGRPIVLDIDDDELAFSPSLSLRHPLRLALSMTQPNGRPWTRMTIACAHRADAVTVASTGLQQQFGGTVVPHSKDTARLRPGLVDRSAARAAMGLGDERTVMFMGTPRPFKGIEDVAEAVRLMRTPARFVVVGADHSTPYVARLMRELPEARFLPPYGLDEVASLLEGADAVVVPQRLEPQTLHQQPSKLLDAMALAKPIVATSVADIPAILADGRGQVVPPGDPAAIARALDAIFDDPASAARMGERARQWCVAHASYDAMQPVLRSIITAAANRR